MNILVTGSGKRIQQQVRDFATYSAKKLMPKMENLWIEIELIPHLLQKEGVYGDSCPDDYETPDRPRDFVIRLDSRVEKRKMLITLAHEMVHVKQFARGELYHSTRKAQCRWQGRWLKDSIDYWDSPWEIEAYGKELGLFVRWTQERKIDGQKWTQEG
jgi:hypothetical protein